MVTLGTMMTLPRNGTDPRVYPFSRVSESLQVESVLASKTTEQGLTLVHVRAQFEQLQDTFMS